MRVPQGTGILMELTRKCNMHLWLSYSTQQVWIQQRYCGAGPIICRLGLRKLAWEGMWNICESSARIQNLFWFLVTVNI